jgi:tRNA(Ile)-lysidine synthase
MTTLESAAKVQAQFVAKVRACLEAWRLPPGKIVVALSGGPDSVALLRGLLFACRGEGWSVAAAHLNHRLREGEAERDEQFVRELCAALDVPLEVEACDVAAEAAAHKKGIEETARQARYAFLARVAERLGAAYVALGHTADDQAETVLHRVLRGTGLAGLAGMPARRPLSDRVSSSGVRSPGDQAYAVLGTPSSSCPVELVRPLLEVSREEVLAFLAGLDQAFVHDATNGHLHVTRNRLRHDLLPKLANEYNPEVRAALVRLARLAGETQEVVTDLADKLLGQAVVACRPNCCELDTRRLVGQHPHLIRACLVRLWQRQGWPLQAMSYAHWERLAELIVMNESSDAGVHRQTPSIECSVPSTAPSAKTLPGRIDARRRENVLVLAMRGGDPECQAPSQR